LLARAKTAYIGIPTDKRITANTRGSVVYINIEQSTAAKPLRRNTDMGSQKVMWKKRSSDIDLL